MLMRDTFQDRISPRRIVENSDKISWRFGGRIRLPVVETAFATRIPNITKVHALIWGGKVSTNVWSVNIENTNPEVRELWLPVRAATER